MATTSAVVNLSLRKYVTPLLREAGFQKLDARNGWRWQEKLVSVFNIRAVGGYFSRVTRWPPGSVCVWLGGFYTFTHQPVWMKFDKKGRLLPTESQCHIRSHLERGLDQAARVRLLRNPEQKRKDIWWLEPDGSAILAGELGDRERLQKYGSLAEAEAKQRPALRSMDLKAMMPVFYDSPGRTC
jgi:hypothetical protein